MHSIMVHVAQSDQVVRDVLASSGMMLSMMQLQECPPICCFRIAQFPSTLLAAITVTFQDFDADIVFNFSIMRLCLP
jgi:hypothetical protein